MLTNAFDLHYDGTFIFNYNVSFCNCKMHQAVLQTLNDQFNI